MRQLLQRALGPPLEAVLRRFEQSVSLEDHAALAARFVSELVRARGAYPTALWSHAANECVAEALAWPDLRPVAASASPSPSGSLEPPDLDGAFAGDAFESGSRQVAVHLAGLLRPELFCDVPVQPGTDDDRAPPTAPEGWSDDPAAVRALRATGSRVLGGLHARRLAPAAADRRLARLVDGFAPRLWFLRRGPPYGTASLLRALVRVAAAGDATTADYTRDVCDRLLRHLEVRRRDFLPFRLESRPPDACDGLERLRFTLALLDASVCFDDARYLNAVLKANDWHAHALSGRGLARASAGRPEAALLLRFYYLKSLCLQEARMREGPAA